MRRSIFSLLLIFSFSPAYSQAYIFGQAHSPQISPNTSKSFDPLLNRSLLDSINDNDSRGLSGGSLINYSYVEPQNLDCYRWMSVYEFNRWQKDGLPILQMLSPEEYRHLERYRRNNKAIFCWTNPLGSIRGGFVEEYGDILVKIRLRADRVLYDRNTKKYYVGGSESLDLSAEQKKGVDSEVIYANYGDRLRRWWFQEIMIKDKRAIESWTFASEEMKTMLEANLEMLESDTSLPFGEFHFYVNWCYGKSLPEESKWSYFHVDARRYYCATYREIARNKIEKLKEFWRLNPQLIGKIYEIPAETNELPVDYTNFMSSPLNQ